MERAGLKSSALTPRPLPPGTWPKASDEADGNTGRPQPGFFRITGKKYFVLYRSQAQNISYSIDHRQKIRILPKRYFGLYLLVGGRKRLVFSGSQVKNISYPTDHRQKIFRTLPITGNKIFVLYRSQAQNISYSIDHRQKIRILPKRYFGLYLLVGGRKRLVFSG